MNKLIHNQINIDFVEHRSEQKKTKNHFTDPFRVHSCRINLQYMYSEWFWFVSSDETFTKLWCKS